MAGNMIVANIREFLEGEMQEKRLQIAKKDKNLENQQYAEKILNLINADQVAELYAEYSSNHDKFVALLKEVVVDENSQKVIINQIKNKMFLLKADQELRDNSLYQMQQAEETIKGFANSLTEYINQISQEKEDTTTSLKLELDKLSELFSCFNKDCELQSVIPDFAFLRLMINQAERSGFIDNSIEALLYLVDASNELYEELEMQIETKISEEIEENRKNIEERILPQNKEYEALDEIIENAINTHNIIAIKAVFVVMGLKNIATITDEKVIEALSVARQDIKEIIASENVTAEEAIEMYFNEYNNSPEEKIQELLGDDYFEEDYNKASIEEIIEKAREFCSDNQKYLLEISDAEQETIINYMRDYYKESSENRDYVYDIIYKKDIGLVLRAATYELQTLLRLIDILPSKVDNKQFLMLKVAKRIESILSSVGKVANKDNIITTEEQSLDEGKLYFAGKNFDSTYLEDDLQIDMANKGITKDYFPEILDRLLQIRKGEITKRTIGANSKYYYTKDIGAMAVRGRKTLIYYVPIANKGAMILGVFQNGEDTPEMMETRIKNNYEQLKNQIENIKQGKITPIEEELYSRIEERVLTSIEGKCPSDTIVDDTEYESGKGAL